MSGGTRHRRPRQVAALLGAGVLGATVAGFAVSRIGSDAAPPAASTVSQQPERPAAEPPPYSPGALFNRPIPDGTPTDPRSGPIVAELVANLASEKLSLLTDKESPPIYVAEPSDPFLLVEVGDRVVRFRVPPDAVVGRGSDAPLTILDPAHPELGRQVELRIWRAEIDREGGRSGGERTGLFHYNNDDARLNPDGSPSQGLPFLGRGTGSGLSYLAGLVRRAEVDGGTIDHAIRFAYGCNDSSAAFRAPAVGTDQPHPDCDRPLEAPESARMDMGMRLQLDPGVDCDRRTAPQLPDGDPGSPGATRFVRIVCHALQRYGMIMMDGTREDGLAIYLEGEPTGGWSEALGPAWFGNYGWTLRDASTLDDGLERDASSGIPWDRLRVVAPFPE